MKVNGILSAFETTMAALSAQTKQISLISENLAHADSLPDQNGKVYRRKVLVQETRRPRQQSRFGDEFYVQLKKTREGHFTLTPEAGRGIKPGKQSEMNVKVVEEPGVRLVYDPQHPLADENGYVRVPDINPVEEMVNLVSATRTYEANVAVMNAAKLIAKKSLEI